MTDDENGWGGKHGAPAATHWHCPECQNSTPVADWAAPESDSRKCPSCGFVFISNFVDYGDKHVCSPQHTAGRISGADEPGSTKYHDGAVERTHGEWLAHLAERR